MVETSTHSYLIKEETKDPLQTTHHTKTSDSNAQKLKFFEDLRTCFKYRRVDFSELVKKLAEFAGLSKNCGTYTKACEQIIQLVQHLDQSISEEISLIKQADKENQTSVAAKRDCEVSIDDLINLIGQPAYKRPRDDTMTVTKNFNAACKTKKPGFYDVQSQEHIIQQ